MNLTEWVELWRHDYKFNVMPTRLDDKKPDLPSWKQYQTEPYLGSFKEDQNVAVICGKLSQIMVIDVDDMSLLDKLFVDKFNNPIFKNILAKTLVIETGKGVHIYCRPHDGDYFGTVPMKGLDIKGEGGYVVTAPSLHDSGKRYKVISTSRDIQEINLKQFITHCKSLGLSTTTKVEKGGVIPAIVKGVTEGGRNQSAYIMARHYLNPEEEGHEPEEAWAKLVIWNSTNKPPLAEDELKTTFDSANDEKFVDKEGEKIVDIPDFADKMVEVFHPITLRENKEIFVYKNEKYLPQGDTYIMEEIRKIDYGMKQKHVVEILNMIMQTTYQSASIFDTNEDYLHTKNCVIDIKTMKTFENSHKFITRNQISTTYDKNAECPKILEFLDRIMDTEEDKEELLDLLATILIHKHKFERAIVFVGEQANGKSTLIEVIIAMLGSSNIANNSLQYLAINTHATASLRGVMLNAYNDLDDKEIQHTGMIKQLISQDHVKIDMKFKETYITRLKIRMLFAANVLPELPANDQASFRRFWIINFPFIIPPEERDLRLIEKLTTPEELSGFLNILLERANYLLNNDFKFRHPQPIEKTKMMWLEKSDAYLTWIKEECVENPNEKISGEDMQYWFNDWAFKHNEKPCTAKKLYNKIIGNSHARKYHSREKGINVIMFQELIPRAILKQRHQKDGQGSL